VAICAGLVLPAAAPAATYCVNAGGACDQSFSAAQLQDALDAARANPGLDRVQIGSGTYSRTGGFSYDASGTGAGNYIEIAGAGAGGGSPTVITAPGGDGVTSLSIFTNAFPRDASTISDLRVDAPSSGLGVTGMSLAGATATGTIVTVPSGVASGTGLAIGAATFRDGVVSVPYSSVNLNAVLGSVEAFVEDSTIAGFAGVHNDNTVGGTTTVRRSTIFATIGLWADEAAPIEAHDVVIKLVEVTPRISVPVGVQAFSDSFLAASLTGDHLTIYGDNRPGAIGAYANAPVSDANLTLTNSILRAVPRSLVRSGTPPATANLTASYSDYDPTTTQSLGPGTLTEGPGNVNVDPLFVDAAGGDYHLQAGSPVADAGDPAACGGTDRDGNPRVRDADGDGTARTDMGAFELQAGGQCPPVVEPPPASDMGSLPSNDFSLGKPKSRRNGSAVVTATVPGAGELVAADTSAAQGHAAHSQALIKPVEVAASGPGPVRLRLKPTRAAKQPLEAGDKVKLTVTVTYTPSGGTSNSKATKVKLKRRH